MLSVLVHSVVFAAVIWLGTPRVVIVQWYSWLVLAYIVYDKELVWSVMFFVAICQCLGCLLAFVEHFGAFCSVCNSRMVRELSSAIA